MSRRIVWTVLLAGLAAAATPAAADWLVLNDGSRVETAGPWEMRGGLVVFTLAGSGTLSSLRASEVDMSASEAATEEAEHPPEPPPAAPPEPKKKARVVLTEKDLPPVTRASAGGETEGEAPAEGAAAATGTAPAGAADTRLSVTDWNASTPDDYDGTVVTGRLRNVSDQLLTRVAVTVLVYNTSGTLLGRSPAEVTPGPMPPDRIFDFEARFPGVYGVTTARFDAQGVGFLQDQPTTRPAASAPAASEGSPPAGG